MKANRVKMQLFLGTCSMIRRRAWVVVSWLSLASAMGCTALLGDFTDGTGDGGLGVRVGADGGSPGSIGTGDAMMPFDASGAPDATRDAFGGEDAEIEASTLVDARIDAPIDGPTDAPDDAPLDASCSSAITTSGPATFCSGGSVTLTSSAATSYLWSTGATTRSITVDASGAYTVTTTSSSGCSATSAPTAVNAETLSAPTITAQGPLTLCPSDTVTLLSSAASSYLWSTDATTRSITVSTAGDYSVTATDANGCSATSSAVNVTTDAPATPTISAGGATTFCQGGSVILASSAASSYVWSTGATTQNITVTTSGSYTVTTEDASGCPVTSAATTVSVDNPSGNVTFNYTGGEQTWNVPTCVTSVTISMTGAAGGSSSACGGSGGLGGYVSGTYAIPAGTTSLEVFVGGAGESTAVGDVGGYNGGGAAFSSSPAAKLYSGTGGGASDVRLSPALDDRIMVAGGGGGAGCNSKSSNDNGGAGGGLTGGVGPLGDPSYGDGLGGTQSAGGVGATCPVSTGCDGQETIASQSGGLGTGGDPTCTTSDGVPAPVGGGGGAGYYGGGGGCWEGGGGGSSYLGSGFSNVTDTQGYSSATGDGSVTISW
jgi:large repetitive protein